jgi:hypothetical protein
MVIVVMVSLDDYDDDQDDEGGQKTALRLCGPYCC